jgi:chemotaxis protein MotA
VTRGNLFVVATCALLFAATFVLAGNAAAYVNFPALIVVLSGTLGATFLSYPFEQIKSAWFVARGAYRTPPTDPDEVVKALLDVALQSKVEGLQSLERRGEQTTLAFLRDALQMLADNYDEQVIRDILSTEIYHFRQRRAHNERVFRSLASYAPSFGLAGSVIGLIGLLYGLGDTGEVLKYIPIALVSTLYGILFGSFVFVPAAECIRDKTEREVLTQKLIIEGAVAIKTETNPHILEKKLSSFLTPAARREARQSFADMRQKYVQMVRARREAAEPAPAAPVPAREKA